MPSRFGLKDAIVVVLLLGVGLSVWLKIVQDDRQWRKLTAIESRLAEIERRLGETGRAPRGEAGNIVAAPPGPEGSSPAVPSASHTPARDVTWAIAGVPIHWAEPFAPATDPRTQPGFREGGALTELLEGDPVCITPLVARSAYARRVIELVCEGLADYHPRTLALRGRLAEAWQVDGASGRLRIKIRDQAVFSDGSPVTAADVVWTFEEVILNPVVEGVGVRADLGGVREVKALAERVVEFSFSSRTYTLEQAILTQPVLPRAYYSTFTPGRLVRSTGLLMGSGPFRLEGGGVGGAPGEAEWKKDTPVVLVRNDRYWGPRAPLDRITFVSARDPVARLESYRKGEADIVTPSSAQMAALMKDEAFAREHRLLSWVDAFKGLNAIAWQCGSRGERGGRASIFADARVRRAMTMLLDREMMLREFYQGQGELATGPFNPRSPMSTGGVKPLPFDPAGAATLLEQAGWRDRDGDGVLEDEQGRRFEFEFTRLASQESDRLTAAYLADQCAKAKIVCRDNPVADSAAAQSTQSHQFDAIRWSNRFSTPEPDPMSYWHSQSISTESGGRNFVEWSNPEADRLIEQGRAELDPDRRRAVWARLEALIAQEQPWTFIRYSPALCVARREIGNVQPYPGGLQLWEMFRASVPGAPSAATGSAGAGTPAARASD